ncbi:hypothetical protein BV22DRAFT_595205 [Leucogyrophana mollusca]|uniref:Uncharacterized protein n=1 Tax=Leucogyrophana mollusca TaxID=85980 RepID=A0ACB8BCB2_9AGAM|nr:hypothetical protein BV22DRAFT_595205 [Leucogyrophana mollusca]
MFTCIAIIQIVAITQQVPPNSFAFKSEVGKMHPSCPRDRLMNTSGQITVRMQQMADSRAPGSERRVSFTGPQSCRWRRHSCPRN